MNDALALKATQDVVQNEFLIQNLLFIKTYLRTIAGNTKKLEALSAKNFDFLTISIISENLRD